MEDPLITYTRNKFSKKSEDKDWILARMAAEFAFKMAEKGHNLEYTLIELAKVFK